MPSRTLTWPSSRRSRPGTGGWPGAAWPGTWTRSRSGGTEAQARAGVPPLITRSNVAIVPFPLGSLRKLIKATLLRSEWVAQVEGHVGEAGRLLGQFLHGPATVLADGVDDRERLEQVHAARDEEDAALDRAVLGSQVRDERRHVRRVHRVERLPGRLLHPPGGARRSLGEAGAGGRGDRVGAGAGGGQILLRGGWGGGGGGLCPAGIWLARGWFIG